MSGSLAQRLAEAADLVTVALDALLPRAEGPEQRLTEAMRYAALGPGGRLRPFFALETAKMFSLPERPVLRSACAIECIYAYGLIHHELPCMDDEDMRRGRATLHRAYDQATAVLAGDALQATAFEILSHPDTHEDPAVRVELVRRLALAAGARGMVGGQMIEVLGVGEEMGQVARMQRMKTGALIACAFEIPLAMARVSEAERQSLMGFAQDLGLAYQIVDDLIGVEGDTTELGVAAPSRGAAKGKANYVTRLGVMEAKERVGLLADQARAHLEAFGPRAQTLKDSVDFVLDRRY
ncbi:MAG TPA: polyprenyl synthetase family protein [Caulobacteraceae bacterium]|nr:polyprenyl synthetase family protein [Caulobacteraceae bacterium]